ncbi:tRNA guanosine-2'-O-methyltransferase, putative [Plasmodium gallinaceum]|uniref:tRNA guanosine-2'-O-methyltransferase, putative n=1 Tax=Plasmodium gallinaceum TaxID=5849 RepID=A0A1J1GRT1_PLAGA|nr:tRNA guanosine-2'-O-methyltransferase, putative [Plasmodium gallinaceum]CRG95138.1 tRNA guanosine-2'-O-methyltransferase, putative [Plasmodium gallinaceum]
MSYLIWFSSHNRYDNCKISELKSLLEIFGHKRNELWLNEKQNNYEGEVFLKVNITDEELWKNIQSRSILIKGVIDLWSEGISYNDLQKNLITKKYLFERNLRNKKWCFYFHSFGKVINQNDKKKKMDHFKTFFDEYKDIDIINPDVQIALFEEYDKKNSEILKKVYFGKCIVLRKYQNSIYNINSETNEKTKVSWWKKYALNKRPILGPTTTDNELAFIMCNLAKVKKGHIVLDPFVGSGGLLVSCSIFNAICIGNDIDIRLLKGYKLSYLNPHMKHQSNKKNIFQNFLYYNLNMPDILVSDNSKPIWNFFHKPWVDAIVTDPPYGNRATVRISVKNSSNANNKEDNICNDELSETSQVINNYEKKLGKKKTMNNKTITYNCTAAVRDLLNIASHTLVDNGMLVFLLPVQLKTIREEIEILNHSDFYLISYDLQTLTSFSGRLIVSMQRKSRILLD